MKKDISPNKNIAAVCGLFCGSCSVYIATQENDVEKLQFFSNTFNMSIDEILCDGCRAERKSAYCRNMCNFIKCAAEKNVDFCGFCNDFPCAELKEFQTLMPHRLELWNSHKLLQEVGWEKWFAEMTEFYSCPNCGTINSAYSINCSNCNTEPSNKFVAAHKDEIIKHFEKHK